MTPIYHPSGLLMSMGGAIAGGARLAIARDFDPATFWAEVRRYGITVASYTWTMLREIADAPEDPAEHHHPVRLFIGAGMPRGLWRRVARALLPGDRARVLRLDRGRGDPGQPERREAGLQGPAAARVAPRSGWPPTTSARGACASAPTGSRSSASPGEVGMLLTRLRGVVSTSESPLRGLFEPDDAWLATGDLFRADEDGDLWLVDHVGALIRTEHGHVASFPIIDALGDLDAVDLAVVYGVAEPATGRALAVAAVTLRRGFELDAEALSAALATLARRRAPGPRRRSSTRSR